MSTQNPYSLAKWEKIILNDKEVTICNCAKSSLSVISLTSKEDVAASYNMLRESDGSDLKGKKPINAKIFEVDYPYLNLQKPQEGPIYKSRQMEDKFDIYFYQDTIYFTRSWTGDLVILVNVDDKCNDLRLLKIIDSVNDDSIYSLRYVDYLIKSHCLNMIVPHPLPEKLRDADVKEVAVYSFSNFGRRAFYGSFEDTLNIYNEMKYDFL